jgi:hypothetical protein
VPIIIRDETANLRILTINNSGQMAFGDGTPINMLTLAGYGIIDSNGKITHGAGSNTPVPSSGSGNCGVNQTVLVTTVAGRIPNVQLDTNFPAGVYTFNPVDPNGTGPFGEIVNLSAAALIHGCTPAVGSFTIFNSNSADPTLTNPSSPNYDGGTLATAPFAYRWI